MSGLPISDELQEQLVKDQKIIHEYDPYAKIFVDKQEPPLVFWKGSIRSQIEYRIYYLVNYPNPADVLLIFPALKCKFQTESFEQVVSSLQEIQFDVYSSIRKQYQIPWWVSDPGQERLIHETEEMEARNFILTRNENTIVFTAAQNIPNPKLKWQGKLVLELPDNYPEVLPNISIELADRHLYNPSEYLKSLYLPVGAPLEQIAYAVITQLSKSTDSPILNKSGKNTKKVIDLDSDSADSATGKHLYSMSKRYSRNR